MAAKQSHNWLFRTSGNVWTRPNQYLHPLPVLAQWKRLMQVVETYIDAVRALDQVSGIFANDSHGLTVYTVYRGDRRQARAAIYDAYQEIMNRFPDILIDFHTVTCNNAEAAPISEKE